MAPVTLTLHWGPGSGSMNNNWLRLRMERQVSPPPFCCSLVSLLLQNSINTAGRRRWLFLPSPPRYVDVSVCLSQIAERCHLVLPGVRSRGQPCSGPQPLAPPFSWHRECIYFFNWQTQTSTKILAACSSCNKMFYECNCLVVNTWLWAILFSLCCLGPGPARRQSIWSGSCATNVFLFMFALPPRFCYYTSNNQETCSVIPDFSSHFTEIYIVTTHFSTFTHTH